MLYFNNCKLYNWHFSYYLEYSQEHKILTNLRKKALHKFHKFLIILEHDNCRTMTKIDSVTIFIFICQNK